MDRNITLTYEMLALESAATPGALLDTGVAKITALFSDVGSFVTNSFSGLQGLLKSNNDVFNMSFVRDTVDGLNFMSVSSMEVPVPMGLSVPFKDYVMVLSGGQGYADSLLKEVLNPTIDYLAKLIAHPQEMVSIRGSESKVKFRDIKKYKEELGRCLDAKAQLSKAPFKKVFQRLADYEYVGTSLNEYNRSMAAIEKEEILERAERAVELLNMLHDRLQASSDTKMSGTVAGHLAKVAMNLAEEVELFGAYCHKLQEATESYKHCLDRINSFNA